MRDGLTAERLTMLMQDRVAQLLPKREGHFVFESGHHGGIWLDLELLALHPERLRPLVEGAFVGPMVATELGLPFTYSSPSSTT